MWLVISFLAKGSLNFLCQLEIRFDHVTFCGQKNMNKSHVLLSGGIS